MRVLGLALIAAIAWLVGVLAFVVEDLALSRYRMDIADNRHARRIRTQVILLRRTRRESAVLGAVEFDLDWSVPVNDMRAEMHRIVENTELWDRRVSVLQVTDAIGDHVRIRVLVSGKDGPTTFDLRCHVREALVDWLRRRHPVALPRTRIELDRSSVEFGSQNGHGGRSVPTERVRLEKEAPEVISDARLFTGSAEAEERSRA